MWQDSSGHGSAHFYEEKVNLTEYYNDGKKQTMEYVIKAIKSFAPRNKTRSAHLLSSNSLSVIALARP